MTDALYLIIRFHKSRSIVDHAVCEDEELEITSDMMTISLRASERRHISLFVHPALTPIKLLV